MKKVKIEVHAQGSSYGQPGPLIEVIERRAWAKCIGNFNPVFCRYKREVHLVHSMEGDLSDPFRVNESYLKSLYIEV
jgi:hypothetical protein